MSRPAYHYGDKLPVITVISSGTASGGRYEDEVIMPGYTMADTDRSYNIALDKMALLVQMARTQGSRSLFAKDDRKKALSFVISAWYRLEPDFYETSAHINGLVRERRRIANVGRSSCCIIGETVSLKSGKVLHNCGVTMVATDVVTRRPIPIPEHRRLLYGDHKEVVPSVEYISKPAMENAPKVTFKLCWSDNDINGHTNQASYIRICMDAITTLALEGRLNKLDRDPAFMRAKELTTLYKSETVPGDILDVDVWQDGCNPLRVICDAMKIDKSIFQMTVTFVEQTEFANL